MSDSNSVKVSYAKETTFGVTPTGPAPTLKDLRYVSETIGQETETTKSDEVRSDRMTSEIIRTGISAPGDINVEISYGTYDDFLEWGLMSTAWSAPVTVTASTISVTGVGTIADSGSGFGSILANRWIRTTGFTGSPSTNNGYFKTTAAAAGSLTVTPATLVIDAAGEAVTVVMGGYVKNGTTLSTMVVEKDYVDLNTPDVFGVINGLSINGFTLTIPTKGKLTGVWNLIGKIETSGTATVGSGTNTAATTTPIMNSIDNVFGILEAQSTVGIVGATMSWTNNNGPRDQVATLGPIGIRTGQLNVTGTLRLYFTTVAQYTKYLAFTDTSLAIVLRDNSSNAYVFDMPAVKLTNGKRVSPGISQDVIADFSYEAKMHATELLMLSVTRFAA